jgi:DNA-binding Xre family transcriptional regulator
MKSRLNVVLAERRMTKRQLQEATGHSKATIYLWSTDKGIEGVTLGKLKRVADVLGCHVGDLYEE